MKLESIVNLIRLVLNKERMGQVKASEIDTAIKNAERDLYTGLTDILYYKGVVPLFLLPFKGEADVNFYGGKTDASPYGIHDITGARLGENSTSSLYEALIARNDTVWSGGDMSHLLNEKGEFTGDVSKYLKSVTSTSSPIQLPPEFIRYEGGYVSVNGEEFPVSMVTPKEWADRKVTDFIEDPNKPDEPFWLNIEEDVLNSGDFSGDAADLPSDVIRLVSFDNIVDGDRYEGVVVDPSKLSHSGIRDLYSDESVMKRHIAMVHAQITLNNGVGVLPPEFVDDSGVFYAGDFEGVILDSKSFYDRVESSLLAPTEQKPIAMIHGGKIEVRPVSITSITLPHYNWPNQKQPVGCIEGGKFRMLPEPTEEVRIKTLKNATERRPVVKLVDGAIEVKPSGVNPVTIEFIAFPTEKAPMIRYKRLEPVVDGGGPSDVLSVRPETIGFGRIYYIKKLSVSKYAYTVNGRDYVFDPINSVDTMFGHEAISEIASRALIYLGVSKQNAQAVQVEAVRDQSKAGTT